MTVLTFPTTKTKLLKHDIEYLMDKAFKDLQDYTHLQGIPEYHIENLSENHSKLIINNAPEDYNLFMAFFIGFNFTRSISNIFINTEE
jgi:hypothetical protein